MLEVRHSLIFVCRARRPPHDLKRKSGNLPPLHCFKCHGMHPIDPIGLLSERRSSTSCRTWERSTRLVSDVWWVRVCVWVAGGTRGGKVISQLLQCQGEREEIIMYSKRSTPISNTMACNDFIDHRCFITYSFTIIGWDFCPFASVYTHNSPL